jgi:hypothetical protein
VQEITVDGDVVFSAQTLPVAYSNLIAWYPFDSATYGGSNADDVTAILGGSGDDTAYDGTVDGAIYDSTGGVTDINAGANSGAFSFDGIDDDIDTAQLPSDIIGSNTRTLSYFVKFRSFNSNQFNHIVNYGIRDSGESFGLMTFGGNVDRLAFFGFGGNVDFDTGHDISLNQFEHHCVSYDGSTVTVFVNGSQVAAQNRSLNTAASGLVMGADVENNKESDIILDDVRLYDTALSSSQVLQIYQNTQP